MTLTIHAQTRGETEKYISALVGLVRLRSGWMKTYLVQSTRSAMNFTQRMLKKCGYLISDTAMISICLTMIVWCWNPSPTRRISLFDRLKIFSLIALCSCLLLWYQATKALMRLYQNSQKRLWQSISVEPIKLQKGGIEKDWRKN